MKKPFVETLFCKIILRLTLPIVWLILLFGTAWTVIILGPICVAAAAISWVVLGDAHTDYTMPWCVIPLLIGFLYVDWLKTKDILKP